MELIDELPPVDGYKLYVSPALIARFGMDKLQETAKQLFRMHVEIVEDKPIKTYPVIVIDSFKSDMDWFSQSYITKGSGAELTNDEFRRAMQQAFPIEVPDFQKPPRFRNDDPWRGNGKRRSRKLK